jgi:hypothetical protein
MRLRADGGEGGRAVFRRCRAGGAGALYFYEGTYQMQHLILGKPITGFSAFV